MQLMFTRIRYECTTNRENRYEMFVARGGGPKPRRQSAGLTTLSGQSGTSFSSDTYAAWAAARTRRDYWLSSAFSCQLKSDLRLAISQRSFSRTYTSL
jgi:hypothetical protein